MHGAVCGGVDGPSTSGSKMTGEIPSPPMVSFTYESEQQQQQKQQQQQSSSSSVKNPIKSSTQGYIVFLLFRKKTLAVFFCFFKETKYCYYFKFVCFFLSLGFSSEVFEQQYSQHDKVHRTKVLVVHDKDYDFTQLCCHPTKVITM